MPFTGDTVNDGVFSPWKGHRPSRFAPLFLRVTNSPTTSSTWAASKIFSTVSRGITGLLLSQRYRKPLLRNRRHRGGSRQVYQKLFTCNSHFLPPPRRVFVQTAQTERYSTLSAPAR